jgi:hypothetical protein
LVSIKQQLAAKPNPMELNALRQRLADIKWVSYDTWERY